MTQRTAAATWSAALGQLELQVTRANYETWLRDTVGLRHESGHFVVGATNDFATEWLATRMRKLIAAALARVIGEPIDVAFEVVRAHGPEPVALAPLEDAAAIPEHLRKRMAAPPSLNPALTFEAFIVGEENRLAFESARAAVARPGAVNPLVIYGEAGLGKTHLLSAIGHAAHEAGRAVLFATAERFGNDYVRALNGQLESFRSRYRGCDVLIIDDVQFLEGKEKFQEEFFHAFNDLHAMGKQVVIAADRAPSQIEGLGAALRSRLQWGLIADMQKPSYETRLAILRAKAARHTSTLPDDALAAIADRCCPSVRELEGYLNRVIAFAPLVGLSHATCEPRPVALRRRPGTAISCRGDHRGGVPRGLTAAGGRSRARGVAYARHWPYGGRRAFGRGDRAAVQAPRPQRGAVGDQRIAMGPSTRTEQRRTCAPCAATSRRSWHQLRCSAATGRARMRPDCIGVNQRYAAFPAPRWDVVRRESPTPAAQRACTSAGLAALVIHTFNVARRPS
jgi:chromosomal replication initiator protein